MRRGILLRCYPHSTAASAVLYVGYPEWREMRFLLDFLSAGDIFVDVGANVGVYSLLACSVPDVEVWAFEPSTRAFARAVENMRLNHLEDRLHVVQSAVGAQRGTGYLTMGLDTVNRLEVVPSRTSERVEVVDLESFLPHAVSDRKRLAMMKVDVEGGEPEVLVGAEELLGVTSPILIVERNNPDELRTLLAPKGYAPFDYDPATGTVVAVDWGDQPNSQNLLLCKDIETVRSRVACNRQERMA